MAITSAVIPRLPTIPSPRLREVLTSGWAWREGDHDTIVPVRDILRRTSAGETPLGPGFLLPLNKGFVLIPKVTTEDLAAKGDALAIVELVAGIAKELAPIPTAIEVGEKLLEAFEVDLTLPILADARSQRYFRLMVQDERTFALPYVDLIGWRESTDAKVKTFHLTKQTASGETEDYSLKPSPFTQIDLFLARRWHLEFAALVVEIVQETCGPETWREARQAIANLGHEPRPAADRPLTLADLRVDDTPPRFFLGATPEAREIIGGFFARALTAAGFREVTAILSVYFFEDTAQTIRIVPPDYIAWILALTDPKLAGELVRRMAPNLAEQRAMLQRNDVNQSVFRRSYVEMLEVGAQGQGLGRVHRENNGPFY